jgi:tetratricopeptide (TPR) repeat protein
MDEARRDYMDGGKYDQSATGAVPFIAYTYLYAGDPKTAEKCYQDAISNLNGTDPGKVNFAKAMYLQDCASIASFYDDAPKLKELIPQIEPLSAEVGNEIGTQEAKLSQKAGVLELEALYAALDGKFDVAKAKADEMKTTLDPLTDPTKLDGYEFVLGFTAFKEKKFPDAVAHFEKTQQTSVYNKYWLASAYEAAGEKDKAKEIYKKLADYNFNGIEFALIRNEVKKKSASM